MRALTSLATNAAGNVGTASIHVTLDTVAPVVAITDPIDGTLTTANSIAVAWTVDGVAQSEQLTEQLAFVHFH